ncbi:GPI ethanolamine phosphate transferase 2 [Cercospora zeina]
MARPSRVQTATLTLANLLLPIAVLVFARGFFPYKPVLPGLARFEHARNDGETGENNAEQDWRPNAPFDKVIFMVVDALRSDFVYGHDSAMAFTQSLVRSGAAIPFTAHATPPTVTMPRVKALTTGSVPSFLDLILNFAESDTTSSLATQDTWLAQIKSRGGNIVFYGDDTWLKLFPDHPDDPSFFLRSDGTSSFFVSDFTEVDLNVTRHVPSELARAADWDAMIMHYLGLDHIGHKTGPLGPNMLPKQEEMDAIVKLIFEAMEDEEGSLQNAILVLAGDHGMNAGGNHGGSGPGETEPALVFASPKLRDADQRKEKKKSREYECPTLPKEGTDFHYYTKVEQSDLVPTLAALLGLPISRNSVGVSIEEMEGLFSDMEKLDILKRNAEQILQIVGATHGEKRWEETVSVVEALFVTSKREDHLGTMEKICEESDGEKKLACLWVNAQLHSRGVTAQSPSEDLQRAQNALRKFLLAAQDELSGTASSYNIPRMVTGIGLTAFIIGLSVSSFPQLWPITSAGIFFALISLLYGIMMFASSYVEEEQQFWYWLTPAWIAVLTCTRLPHFPTLPSRLRLSVAVCSLLAVHRLSVRWNQTGQKFSGADDIVHSLFPEHHVVMWLLILAAYAYQGFLLVTRSFAGLTGPEVALPLAVVCVLPGVVFKLNFTQADAPELVRGLASGIRALTGKVDLVVQARVGFGVLGAGLLVVVVLSIMSWRSSVRQHDQVGRLPSLAERCHGVLSLFLMMQSRAPNVVLVLGWEMQREALAYLLMKRREEGKGVSHVTAVATSVLLCSHVAYFCAGGSNSISSIDLSNAYNGVADYNILAVGVLLFASNWTGAVWWCSAANLLLSAHEVNAKSSLFAASRAPTVKEKKGQHDWIGAERKRLHEESLKTVVAPGTGKSTCPTLRLSSPSLSSLSWRVVRR